MSGKTGKKKKIKKLLPFLAIPAIFFLDRASKAIITSTYHEGQGFPVIPGIFHVTRVNNTGAAFGMLKGNTSALAVVSLVSVILLSVLIIRRVLLKSRTNAAKHSFAESMGTYALVLVIGGAAGNLYDRIFYGYVVDFLDFRIWPVFNFADTCICVGIFLILLSLFKTTKGC